MTVNSMVLSGNATADPELRLTAAGVKVTTLRIASTERRFDSGVNEWRDVSTTYMDVTCWRTLAENVVSSVHKGDPVVVSGKLRESSYERDGVKHYRYEIEAAHVGHDLNRGVSRFARSTLTRRETFEEATPITPRDLTAVPSDGGPAELPDTVPDDLSA